MKKLLTGTLFFIPKVFEFQTRAQLLSGPIEAKYSLSTLRLKSV